jgi:hypothetical protein
LIRTSLVLALAVALCPFGAAASVGRASALPTHGVLIPGKSLAGVKLGDTMAQVVKRWGGNYKLCKAGADHCGAATWYYIYPQGEPLGAAVKFNKQGRAVALFTLGSSVGWRTAEGLLMGEDLDRVHAIYGQTTWKVCVGYGAMVMRTGHSNTSIYTTGEAVYGFALTAPSESVCQ